MCTSLLQMGAMVGPSGESLQCSIPVRGLALFVTPIAAVVTLPLTCPAIIELLLLGYCLLTLPNVRDMIPSFAVALVSTIGAVCWFVIGNTTIIKSLAGIVAYILSGSSTAPRASGV